MLRHMLFEDPWVELRRLRREMNRLFETFPLVNDDLAPMITSGANNASQKALGADGSPSTPSSVTGDQQQQQEQQQPQQQSLSRANTAGGDLFFGGGRTLFAPRVDVSETDDAICVDAELPGLKKEEINVELRGNNLVLSGEMKRENRTDNERFHRIERSSGSFMRTFPLPPNVKKEEIAARHENGVLHLEIPKDKDYKDPNLRRIDIQ